MAALPASWPRFVLLCLLVLLAAIGFGCGEKKGAPPDKPTKASKKKRVPATQRPYVINGVTYTPIPSAHGYVERGLASWYGHPFHGRKTANSETYNMYGNTAAHKTLPMGTILLVKNLENGRSTVVRINDRGPFVDERIIDLTHAKARELGIINNGTSRVEIVALATQERIVAQAAQERQEAPTTSIAARNAPVKARVKAAPLPDFDKGNFYVQVGAFDEIESARTLARAFAKRGRNVVIQQYPAAGMNLYRVMIFASHSLAQAKRYEKELETAGFRYAMLLAR
ncbi:MAG: septal ring lytic transglycosylase RlpA family protein [Desulfobulbus sp.]|jgi:rare lipoprotein A|nr:septal ring lytic transglycosylase RlpA family protein [Desulfobulbus sp.]